MFTAFGAPLAVEMSADTTRRWKMLPNGYPGTWYCPNVAFITSDGAPPSETTSLWLCENLSPRRRSAVRDRNASPVTSSSTPRLFTWPMFWNCTPGKPNDGSAGTCTSASMVFLLYQVNSIPRRSWKNEASAPASISEPTSGLRSTLPRFWGVSVGVPPEPVSGAYVRSAANASGCWPAFPHAVRSLRDDTAGRCDANDSSLTIHDALTFGYRVAL